MTDLTLFDNAAATGGPLASLNAPAGLGQADTKSGAINARLAMRFKNSKFRIQYGSNLVEILDGHSVNVVILGAAPNIQRAYFEGTYDPEKVSGPKCYSHDGAIPAEDAEEKQSEKCSTCPWSKKNSKIVDGRGMYACKFSKTLAALVLPPPNKIAKLGPIPVFMSIASMSIWGKDSKEFGMTYQNFAKTLEKQSKAAGRVINTYELVVKLQFDEDASVPRPLFTPVAWVPEKVAQYVQAGINHPDALAIIRGEPPEYDDATRTALAEILDL